MRPPFIVTTPIRNEAWILERFLAATTLWADHILILDSGCTDQSLEICRRFPKVRILPFDPCYLTSEHRRRHDLFHAARQINPQSIVFTLDADEILSAEILSPLIQQELIQRLEQPGSSLALPWIMLWKSPREYRVEPHGIWSDRTMNCVYWDDGKSDYPFEGFLHFPRVPRQFHHPKKTFDLPLLHYQFSAWKRTQLKQAHWRLLEWEKGPKTVLNSIRINLLYAIARESWEAKTASISEPWIEGYQLHGISLSDSFDDPAPWFISEIVHLLQQKKTENFALLDIWDLPWEIYRQRLNSENRLLNDSPLHDPRSLVQKAYHHLIHGISYFGSTHALRIYQFFKG